MNNREKILDKLKYYIESGQDDKFYELYESIESFNKYEIYYFLKLIKNNTQMKSFIMNKYDDHKSLFRIAFVSWLCHKQSQK